MYGVQTNRCDGVQTNREEPGTESITLGQVFEKPNWLRCLASLLCSCHRPPLCSSPCLTSLPSLTTKQGIYAGSSSSPPTNHGLLSRTPSWRRSTPCSGYAFADGSPRLQFCQSAIVNSSLHPARAPLWATSIKLCVSRYSFVGPNREGVKHLYRVLNRWLASGYHWWSHRVSWVVWFCLRRTRLDTLCWCSRWSETTMPRPHEALLPFSTKNWSVYLGLEHCNSFSLLVLVWLSWCLASRSSLIVKELGYKLQISYPQATDHFYSLSLDFYRAVSKSCSHPRYSQHLSFCILVVSWYVLLGVHFLYPYSVPLSC